jgi:hypothetical protein
MVTHPVKSCFKPSDVAPAPINETSAVVERRNDRKGRIDYNARLFTATGRAQPVCGKDRRKFVAGGIAASNISNNAPGS